MASNQKSEGNLSSMAIPLVRKISEVVENAGCTHSVELNLPQIVVVGSQSAGKSSVLESIIGHSILPRGTGIVTRVPLILNLHCASDGEVENALRDPESRGRKEWVEFLHIPDERFFNMDEIAGMISARTVELAGSNKGVVDTPIFLKMSSPALLDLTVVDLPGITRVPVGDQPSDIEKQIRRLCLKYIEKESSIILAITAANTDISNSDSLQIARSVDPTGSRTVGVLTKVDLMDPGTHCIDILRNEGTTLNIVRMENTLQYIYDRE
jgi:GTP-binding protein EngB required for normal cell division